RPGNRNRGGLLERKLRRFVDDVIGRYHGFIGERPESRCRRSEYLITDRELNYAGPDTGDDARKFESHGPGHALRTTEQPRTNLPIRGIDPGRPDVYQHLSRARFR